MNAATNLTVIPCPDVVIPNGETTSNVIPREVFGDASSITLYAPATLPETTEFEVADQDGNYTTWSDGSSDIAGPAAGKARVYTNFDFYGFRLVANGAVAAERTFKMTKKA